MGNQTNVVFYVSSPIGDVPKMAIEVLQFLGARQDSALFSRQSGPDDSWNERSTGASPGYETLGQRLPLDQTSTVYQPGKTLSIQWFRTDESLRRRFTLEIWETLPHDLLSDHVPGNSDLVLEGYDIFGVETQGKEEDEYFARSTFCVHLWGYRCPTDIDTYRELVMQLSTFKEIKEGLSAILQVPVQTRIYMNM